MECFFSPSFSLKSCVSAFWTFKRPLVQWSAFFLYSVHFELLKGHLSSGVLFDLGFFSCGYQRFTQLYFFFSLRVRIMSDVSSLHLYPFKMLKLITYKRHIRTCITVQFVYIVLFMFSIVASPEIYLWPHDLHHSTRLSNPLWCFKWQCQLHICIHILVCPKMVHTCVALTSHTVGPKSGGWPEQACWQKLVLKLRKCRAVCPLFLA